MNNRFGEKRNGIEFVHSFFCIKGKCWWLRLGARLHGHAIFGVVSVSDTCRTPVRVRLAWFRCPASVSFFFFCFSDTALMRLRHASSEKKKKKKSQMSDLSPLPTATAAALCRLPELDRADRRAAPLSLFFFCFFYVFFFFFVHFNFSNTFLYFLFVLWVFCQPHVKVTLTIEYHMSVMMSLICNWSRRK